MCINPFEVTALFKLIQDSESCFVSVCSLPFPVAEVREGIPNLGVACKNKSQVVGRKGLPRRNRLVSLVIKFTK